ncbi:MAG: DNRLRE domain-containing protein [Phycisphaeraceae bacterium]|nr:DNRLRE domain-containing protein [Phycisphaeraceae bacterium]
MKKAIWAASILSSGLCFGVATADEIQIPLNNSNGADNFLYNNDPLVNFGPNGLYYYDERGISLDKGRPIVRVNLASLPSHCSITKVEYRLWLSTYTFIDVNNGNATVPWAFGLYPMKVDWDEYGSNWIERMPGVPWSAPGMVAGVDYESSPASSIVVSAPSNRYIAWDITALYNSWESGARANFGFHIRGPAGNPLLTTNTGDTTDGVFSGLASEYDDDERRPQLVITFITGPCPCPADLNGDTFVDDADFVIFANSYNILDCADPTMPPGCPGDINADGVVDDADFVEFAAAYNTLICP